MSMKQEIFDQILLHISHWVRSADRTIKYFSFSLGNTKRLREKSRVFRAAS